ncbi:MAG: hypothetical protein IPK70_00215 [Flavobacteriales bacterium]|nr:hypothetical protein [Flavobacteriales bacterium]
MRTLALLPALALCFGSSAQNDRADSLRDLIGDYRNAGSLADTVQAVRFRQLTRAFINAGNLDSAAAVAQAGVDFVLQAKGPFAQEAGWLKQRMQAHKLVGMVSFYRGHYDEALEAMQDYQRDAALIGSATDEGAAYNYMSYCFRSMNDDQQAERYARKAIGILRALEPDEDLADAFTGLASTMADGGRIDSAQRYNRLAIGVYRRTGNVANATNTWLNMAGNWARIEAYDSCSAALDQARAGLEQALPDAWMKYHAHTGQYLLATGRIAPALIALDSAMHLAQELGSAEAVAHVGALQALSAAASGRYREAIALQRKATDALVEDLDLERTRALTEARLTFEHEQELAQAEERTAQQRKQKNLFLVIGALTAVLSIALLVLVSQTRRSRALIRKERDRNEELLLNILPAEVAQELKDKGESQARLIDEATILFSDFMGFTGVSEQLSPQELVEELNACFKAFDDIITARGVEKIKTIGDAYMAAGGLSGETGSSALNVVLAALDMQDFMSRRRALREALGRPAFAMRVGIHTGPVVAGIVGVKKFQYDIWGDTVNTANRMESTGEPDRVNISNSTRTLIAAESGLRFHERGIVEAKGKGGLAMWFVERA